MPRKSLQGRQIDQHVGDKLRVRRAMLGLSQMDLAARLNISYQQVQKYESGQSGISASRLYQVAHCLDVPIGYFFEGLNSALRETDTLIAQSNDARKLVMAYSKIRNSQARQILLHLTRAVGRLPGTVDGGR